jgi:hypothetical protein
MPLFRWLVTLKTGTSLASLERINPVTLGLEDDRKSDFPRSLCKELHSVFPSRAQLGELVVRWSNRPGRILLAGSLPHYPGS